MSMEKLILNVDDEIKSMIKSDAKAVGMTLSGYVSFCCAAMNDAARDKAVAEFAQALGPVILSSLSKDSKDNH